MPKLELPYLYLVLAGSLRLYTPSGILDYVPGQYSISRIDTPLSGRVLTYSERGDFLALAVAFSPNDVIQTLLELDNDLTERIVGGTMEGRETAAADLALVRSVYRLFPAMYGAVPSRFLQKNMLREILYYALCSSCGSQLIQSIAQIGHMDEIYAANSWIKENFRLPLSVEALAERGNMSVSLFHQRFKSAVGMGPLQCQKRLRLTEARRLMLDEDRNVT